MIEVDSQGSGVYPKDRKNASYRREVEPSYRVSSSHCMLFLPWRQRAAKEAQRVHSRALVDSHSVTYVYVFPIEGCHEAELPNAWRSDPLREHMAEALTTRCASRTAPVPHLPFCGSVGREANALAEERQGCVNELAHSRAFLILSRTHRTSGYIEECSRHTLGFREM